MIPIFQSQIILQEDIIVSKKSNSKTYVSKHTSKINLEAARPHTVPDSLVPIEKARGKVTRAPAIVPSLPMEEDAQVTEGNYYLHKLILNVG